MRQLVMLDFDGVIVDSLDVTCDVAVTFFQEHGFRRLASRRAVLSLLDQNWCAQVTRAGLDPDTIRALDAAPLDALETRTQELPAVPGMRAAIEQISTCHTVLIITSNYTRFVHAFLRRMNVHQIVEVMGADRGTSKVRKILSALGCYEHPGGCWYAGDTTGDIREAHAAGVPAIAATWGWHSAGRLLAASPDAIAHEPADLVRIVCGARTPGWA